MNFEPKITWLAETVSTNHEATQHLTSAAEGSVWATLHQTAGRGQQGNRWESEAGKNLLFSLLLRPEWLPADYQFYISKVTSLGVRDFLVQQGLETSIKWPNDGYADNRKMVGILIEHHLGGNVLNASVIGIGINLNQEKFVSDAPNPTSFKLETGRSLDLQKVLPEVIACIMYRYRQLEQGLLKQLDDDYRHHLYRFDEWHWFEKNGKRFRGKIAGVHRSGELSMEHDNGVVKNYVFKEIAFVNL